MAMIISQSKEFHEYLRGYVDLEGNKLDKIDEDVYSNKGFSGSIRL